MQQVCVSSFSAAKFSPTFYAELTEPVSAPQPTTQGAMKQILYVLKQAEKLMPPSSFGMLRRALFTVRSGENRWDVVHFNAVGEGYAMEQGGNGEGRRGGEEWWAVQRKWILFVCSGSELHPGTGTIFLEKHGGRIDWKGDEIDG